MQAKHIKPGLVVAIGTHPGDNWAQRAVVIDADRSWKDVSDRWARKPRYVKTTRTSLTKYAVAAEQPRYDGDLAEWVPKLVTGREILASWNEHLVQAQVYAKRAAEDREHQKADTDERLAWHRDVARRAKALGVSVRGQWTSRDVTISSDDVDRLLALAEAGAATEQLADA